MNSTERSLKIFCDANVLFRGTTLLVRDASDIPIALAAAAAGVDYLITTGPDLTNEETAKRLQEQLGLRVLRVGEFLNKVMGYSHETLTGISQRRWVDLGEAPAWEESDESPANSEPCRRL
ncbi:MAG TPA: hypothetical protein EYP55_11650 [Anaerolineae bacterium]|nr:hypothetical protein [Anaerolineae bacterium]